MKRAVTKAILVSFLVSFLSGLTLLVLYKVFGATGFKALDSVIEYVPIILGAVIGMYAGKRMLSA